MAGMVNQAAFNFSSVRGKLSECEDATALLDSLLPWLQGMLLNISVYIQSCFSVQVSLN